MSSYPGDALKLRGRAMRSTSSALTAACAFAAPAWAQGPTPRQMHDWMGWGSGGMWLGPLFMIIPLALLIIAVVALVRWMGGGSGNGGGRLRTARDLLDERYARGEIEREEYLRRRDDMAGRSYRPLDQDR
jgi:putative membrane protein